MLEKFCCQSEFKAFLFYIRYTILNPMHLPPEVQSIITRLRQTGFEAFAVGGSVRDLLLKRQPQDWDVATSATPPDIQKLFPKHFYANRFGTVTVLTESTKPTLQQIEVTTYRLEGEYEDQRRPSQVTFTANLEQDLARRDFTINAIALDDERILDPWQGQRDVEEKLIRAVGDPNERFGEDALRLIRAVRLAAQLGFTIEPATKAAITQHASSIQAIAKERVRDELVKIVMSDNPEVGFNLLEETKLLAHILPELAEGVRVEQNKHHIYTVFVHNVKSLQYAADYDYSFIVRLAALLHDIGKPRTRRLAPSVPGTAPDYTFYGHDIVGARMAERLLKRLRFPAEDTKVVTHLIRYHMFYYDIGKVTEAGMRRLLRRVGPEHFDDLIKLRVAERKGSGVPKARPYRLRHLQFMAEKVSQQAITTSQLAINGHDLMQTLNLPPGKIIGGILNALLAEVIEDPSKNTRQYLMERARHFQQQNPEQLKAIGQQAVETEEKKREDDIRRKYHV